MKRHFANTRNPFLRGLKFFGIIILGAMAAAAFAFIFGYFVMLLWNWLMPEIFGLITISFWQAAGLVLLARLVFGGFKHGHDHSTKTDKKSKFFDKWKDRNCGEYSAKNWKYFDDFWWDEGEKSYNDYIERKKEQEQK